MGIQLVLGFTPSENPSPSPDGGSWDEVYYLTGGDPDAAITAWTTGVGGTGSQKTNAGYLVSVAQSSPVGMRLSVLSISAMIYYIRASVVGMPRVASFFRSTLIGKSGFSFESNAAQPVDVFATGLLFQIQTTDKRSKRNVLLRGIPDVWTSNNELTDEGTKAVQSMVQPNNIFQNFAIAGWALNRRINANVPANVFPILTATQATQGKPITLTVGASPTLPIPTFSAGQFVDLVNVNNPLMRGRWKVINPSGLGQLTLRGSGRYSVPDDFSGGVVFDNKEQVGVALNTLRFLRVGEKKTGKKKYLQRGRRSAVQLRH